MSVAKHAAIEVMERPKAPHDLTDEEVEVWSAVTQSQAADWFDPANLPILTQYCRHVVRARHVAEMIERSMGAQEALALEDYDRLLKMQQRESAAISMLATKMRIVQTSTINQRGNKKPSTQNEPWNFKVPAR
jgi:hypothetical protein